MLLGKERLHMENNEKITKNAKLTKTEDSKYLLTLSVDENISSVIDVSDTEQQVLNEQYAKIIRYCIVNGANFMFSLEVGEGINAEDDSGVINVVKEYLAILNNELVLVHDKWIKQLEQIEQ